MIKNHVKTTSYLQMEASECGAVCLQIILAYYGCYQSLEKLRELCGVSRDGVNAANIIKAASLFGLQGEGLMADLEKPSIEENLSQLCEVPFPYIIFWEFNHFVVLEGIKGTTLFINDPAKGRYPIDYSTFSNKFTGMVLSFEKSEHFRPIGKPTKIWPGLWERLKDQRAYLFNVVLISVLLIFPGIIIPGLSKIFIDNILIRGQEDWVIPFLWTLLFIGSLETLLMWMQYKTLLYLQINLGLTQGIRFFKHLFTLPMTFYDQRMPGDINQRLSSNDRIAQSLSGETSVALVSLVSLIFYALVMLLLSPILAAVNLVIAILQFIINYYLSHSLSQLSKLYLQNQGKLIGVATNGVSLIETIKLQGIENQYFNRIENHREQANQAWQQIWKNKTKLMVLPKALIMLNSIIVLAIGIKLIMVSELTIGTLVAFITLMASFQKPLETLAASVVTFKTIEGDLARVDDIFDYRVKKLPEQNTKNTEGKKIGFNKVTFGYHLLSQPLIENVSFEVKQGESLALVGPTGAGKSTLLNCLTGLYQPWQGQILVDDIPIYQQTDNCRSRLVAVVTQQTTLFSGTIRDNMSLANEDMDEQQMIDALKKMHVYDEIALRGGLDAKVANLGSNFSGGQVQRIELARAIAFQPHFLVLDEATSALDNDTEALVMEEIKQLHSGIILAAHRLSTITWCDRILVIDGGKIIESGTHKSLMKLRGLYWQLIKSEAIVDD